MFTPCALRLRGPWEGAYSATRQEPFGSVVPSPGTLAAIRCTMGALYSLGSPPMAYNVQ
jgi:hypothetical protein